MLELAPTTSLNSPKLPAYQTRPGGLGFEPRQKAPEALVLPLHHPPMEWSGEGGIILVLTKKLQASFGTTTDHRLATNDHRLKIIFSNSIEPFQGGHLLVGACRPMRDLAKTNMYTFQSSVFGLQSLVYFKGNGFKSSRRVFGLRNRAANDQVVGPLLNCAGGRINTFLII